MAQKRNFHEKNVFYTPGPDRKKFKVVNIFSAGMINRLDENQEIELIVNPGGRKDSIGFRPISRSATLAVVEKVRDIPDKRKKKKARRA